MGAESQGIAQTLMETQKENNQLKKEREATRVALQKVRDAQAGVTAPGQSVVDAGPPLSAAGQPAPEQPAPGQPAPGAAQAATAGVPWKQWSATNRFKESGMYAKHDNDMYLASAQSELSDAIANIGLEGSEEQRAAAVAKAIQSWSSKHGVRFDSRAEVSEFLSQDVERPPVKERFERVVADALSIASREDIVRRASQAETVEQAVKDVGDRLVAGILAGVGAATDDAEYTAYARERMAEKDTLRRVYDSAAEAVQQAGEQGALDAARWYYRDKNVIRKVVDDLSDYIDNVADGYGALVDTGSERDARRQANVQRTMAGQVRRQQKRHDLLVDERDEALAAQGRAAMRSEDLRVAAEENRGQPSAAEQAAQQLRNKQASVESDIQNLREQVETARGELQAAGLESRATIGRKLRSFMRMRQKYAAMADSGMVDRNVVEALSTEIEQLLKLYRRGPKK
jgi:ribosomal protein S19E (S16A)